MAALTGNSLVQPSHWCTCDACIATSTLCGGYGWEGMQILQEGTLEAGCSSSLSSPSSSGCLCAQIDAAMEHVFPAVAADGLDGTHEARHADVTNLQQSPEPVGTDGWLAAENWGSYHQCSSLTDWRC